MLKLRKNLGESYSPLYFLAALGSGGLSISFFIYLLFLTPHQDTPIPTWESLNAALSSGNPIMQSMVIIAALGIILFALLHLRLLWWNIREYRRFRQTPAFQQLRRSNAEVQLMAIPLTLAMSINVGFVLGASFVPGLWAIVEYLFPFAMLAFAIAGYFAISIFLGFLSRVLVNGSFDCSRNNNLSQMLAIFAFSMIGVGFSASAAMSHVKLTSGIAMVFAIMFITIAVVLAVTKFVLGFRAMFEHGIERESAVSLWIIIPIITLAGIAIFRISMGMHHNFGTALEPIRNMTLFAVLISVQLFFALLGFVVMRRLGYFKEFIFGKGKSAASYALICPGVAGYVLAFFFIHYGLVAVGMIEKYSLAHLLLLVPLVVLQIQTILTLLRLNRKLLKPEAQRLQIKAILPNLPQKPPLNSAH